MVFSVVREDEEGQMW